LTGERAICYGIIIFMKINAYLTIVTSIVFLLATTTSSTFAFERPLITGMQEHMATQGGQTGKVQACQMHAVEIKNRLTHIITLATNIETIFDKHATQVEDYYKTKLLPNGVTVPNYNTLVEAVGADRADVATALTTVQSDATNFSCTATDPKTVVTTFRTDMRVKTALQSYRVSIKNLIVAVRSANGKMRSDNRLTPKPSHTVSVSPTTGTTHP
jgi:ABC-type phosphate/phosphonate transport system substrate-binding protein